MKKSEKKSSKRTKRENTINSVSNDTSGGSEEVLPHPHNSLSEENNPVKAGADEDPTCQVCGKGHLDEEWVLLCDGCGQEFHTYCLSPPLHEIPAGDWYCPLCCPVGRTRELEAYFATHEESRKEMNNSNAYRAWKKRLRKNWNSGLKAKGFIVAEDTRSELMESDALVGQLVLFHTDEQSVHTGRIVDCRLDSLQWRARSKPPKLQFLLFFKSGADGRNKAFTHWCTLEEHACAVGEVRLCLASVVVHKLWTTTNEDPKPCYEFRRSSMGLAIRPDISKQSMSEALAEPKVLSTSAAGEEDAAVEGGNVTARSSASSTDKLVCIRLFSKRCNQYANVVDRGSSWCFVQRSVLRPFRIPDDHNKEDTILFWMAVAEKTERDSAVWTYRFRHIRPDVGGALQSWGNEFGLVDGFKLKHWKALMQFYNLSSAMHGRYTLPEGADVFDGSGEYELSRYIEENVNVSAPTEIKSSICVFECGIADNAESTLRCPMATSIRSLFSKLCGGEDVGEEKILVSGRSGVKTQSQNSKLRSTSKSVKSEKVIENSEVGSKIDHPVDFAATRTRRGSRQVQGDVTDLHNSSANQAERVSTRRSESNKLPKRKRESLNADTKRNTKVAKLLK